MITQPAVEILSSFRALFCSFHLFNLQIKYNQEKLSFPFFMKSHEDLGLLTQEKLFEHLTHSGWYHYNCKVTAARDWNAPIQKVH